eukprot:m.152619 g.152619  ORF g.152619 m.152619 type:complete len:64 (-) comp17893_c0_seq37:2025-2216(-)
MISMQRWQRQSHYTLAPYKVPMALDPHHLQYLGEGLRIKTSSQSDTPGQDVFVQKPSPICHLS